MALRLVSFALACYEFWMQAHPFFKAIGVTSRALFSHPAQGEGLSRLNASRRGLWEGICWVALRTSAIPRPFWGLHQRTVARFARTGCWAVVLLHGTEQGWLLPGPVAADAIGAGKWSLAKDGEYKITPPLPEAWRFASATQAWALLMQYCSPLVMPAQTGTPAGALHCLRRADAVPG